MQQNNTAKQYSKLNKTKQIQESKYKKDTL